MTNIDAQRLRLDLHCFLVQAIGAKRRGDGSLLEQYDRIVDELRKGHMK